jgi:hypothetical protein
MERAFAALSFTDLAAASGDAHTTVLEMVTASKASANARVILVVKHA